MASIETGLVTQDDPATGQPWPNGWLCESGVPVSIEKAVSQAAPLVAVNAAPLLRHQHRRPLTQTPAVDGDANITVTCTGGCTAPTAHHRVAVVQ